MEDISQCNFCLAYFRTAHELRQHIEEAHNEEKFNELKCCYCPLLRPFSTKYNLNKHQRSRYCNIKRQEEEHVEEVSTDASDACKMENITQCDQCSSVFRTELKLKYHIRKDHNAIKLNELKCPHCPLLPPFSTKYNLNKHQRSRYCNKTGQQEKKRKKPFNLKIGGRKNNSDIEDSGSRKNTNQCDICDRNFSTKFALKYHETTHNKKKSGNLKCSYCPSLQPFSTKYNLSKHQRSKYCKKQRQQQDEEELKVSRLIAVKIF